MVKKYQLHLDAVIVLIGVFVISFGFNLYQRYQYGDLLQAYVDVKWENESLQAELKTISNKNEKTDTVTATGDNAQTGTVPGKP